jgi:hypothetical protein
MRLEKSRRIQNILSPRRASNLCPVAFERFLTTIMRRSVLRAFLPDLAGQQLKQFQITICSRLNLCEMHVTLPVTNLERLDFISRSHWLMGTCINIFEFTYIATGNVSSRVWPVCKMHVQKGTRKLCKTKKLVTCYLVVQFHRPHSDYSATSALFL